MYQALGSLHFGGSCRFQPTCSVYALEVLKTQNLQDSVRLIFKRIMNCRPGGKFGYDPAPRITKGF